MLSSLLSAIKHTHLRAEDNHQDIKEEIKNAMPEVNQNTSTSILPLKIFRVKY